MKYLFALLVMALLGFFVFGNQLKPFKNRTSSASLTPSSSTNAKANPKLNPRLILQDARKTTRKTKEKPYNIQVENFPLDDTDDLLQFKTEVSHPYYTQNTQEAYLYTEIKAGTYENPNAKRPSLNLSLVIDRSGSMRGDKLAYVKKAAEFVVNNLAKDDILSIVIYDDNVEVLFESAKLVNKNLLLSKINSIQTNGSTNLSGGLLKGYDQVKKNYHKDYVNRVLLLSDGLANKGITDPLALQNIASEKNQEEGISLSTFGVGLDFNEDLMLNLSEYGSGNYYFIENPDEIPTIFEKELNGLLRIIAQNLQLKITLPQGVKVKQVMGFEKTLQQVGNVYHFNLRDLSSEETKSLVMVLEGFQGEKEVFIQGLVNLNYALENGKGISLESEAIMMATNEENQVNASIKEKVMSQYTMFYSNYLLTQTMQAVDNREYDKAKSLQLYNQEFILSNQQYVDSLPELITQDSLVNDYGNNIDKVKEMNERERQSYQKGSKSSNYIIKSKKGGR